MGEIERKERGGIGSGREGEREELGKKIKMLKQSYKDKVRGNENEREGYREREGNREKGRKWEIISKNLIHCLH